MAHRPCLCCETRCLALRRVHPFDATRHVPRHVGCGRPVAGLIRDWLLWPKLRGDSPLLATTPLPRRQSANESHGRTTELRRFLDLRFQDSNLAHVSLSELRFHQHIDVLSSDSTISSHPSPRVARSKLLALGTRASYLIRSSKSAVPRMKLFVLRYSYCKAERPRIGGAR